MSTPWHHDLSAKRKRFVELYATNGFNGTLAAREAGYAPAHAHVRASRLLQDERVKVALARYLDQYAMSRAEALARVGMMARGEVPTSTRTRGEQTEESFDTLTALRALLKHTKVLDHETEMRLTVVVPEPRAWSA